jgi:hypothetical protein
MRGAPTTTTTTTITTTSSNEDRRCSLTIHDSNPSKKSAPRAGAAGIEPCTRGRRGWSRQPRVAISRGRRRRLHRHRRRRCARCEQFAPPAALRVSPMSADRRRRSPRLRSHGSIPRCASRRTPCASTPTTQSNWSRAYDLVIDCSDNFRTKFLVNDAAVLARKPAVFASVYQYEGQLQVYKPDAAHACLRCLWPDATADGVVGNCAEAGVLGPVPGAFGAMQALLALKILLGIPGQLEGELLLLNFMNFTQLKLKAPRRAACLAHRPAAWCVLRPARSRTSRSPAPPWAAPRRWASRSSTFATPTRSRPAPLEARHIAMPALLADPPHCRRPGRLPVGLRLGQAQRRDRARAAQRAAIRVKSLAGGLQSPGVLAHAVSKANCRTSARRSSR